MKNIKKVFIYLSFFILVVMFSYIGISFASWDDGGEIFKNEKSVVVGPDKHSGDVFVSGEDILIQGDIEGDVFALGQKVQVQGTVSGSVFVAGSEIVFDAKILGNAYLLADKITIEKNAGFAQRLYSVGSEIFINSFFDGRGYVYASTLKFGESAVIAGSLRAHAEHLLGQDRDGLITGAFNHVVVDSVFKNTLYSRLLPANDFVSMLAMFFNFMVLGYFIISLWPDYIRSIYENVRGRMSFVFGYGLLGLVLFPIIVFILWASIIGISTSLVVSAFMIFAIMISRVVFTIIIGLMLTASYNRSKRLSGEVQLWHGLAVACFVNTILSVTPVINVFVLLLEVVGGVGVMIIALKNSFQIKK